MVPTNPNFLVSKILQQNKASRTNLNSDSILQEHCPVVISIMPERLGCLIRCLELLIAKLVDVYNMGSLGIALDPQVEHGVSCNSY